MSGVNVRGRFDYNQGWLTGCYEDQKRLWVIKVDNGFHWQEPIPVSTIIGEKFINMIGAPIVERATRGIIVNAPYQSSSDKGVFTSLFSLNLITSSSECLLISDKSPWNKLTQGLFLAPRPVSWKDDYLYYDLGRNISPCNTYQISRITGEVNIVTNGHGAAICSDSRTMIFFRKEEVWIRDIITGKEIILHKPGKRDVDYEGRPGISLNGSYVIFCEGSSMVERPRSDLYIYNIETRRMLLHLRVNDETTHAFFVEDE